MKKMNLELIGGLLVIGGIWSFRDDDFVLRVSGDKVIVRSKEDSSYTYSLEYKSVRIGEQEFESATELLLALAVLSGPSIFRIDPNALENVSFYDGKESNPETVDDLHNYDVPSDSEVKYQALSGDLPQATLSGPYENDKLVQPDQNDGNVPDAELDTKEDVKVDKKKGGKK